MPLAPAGIPTVGVLLAVRQQRQRHHATAGRIFAAVWRSFRAAGRLPAGRISRNAPLRTTTAAATTICTAHGGKYSGSKIVLRLPWKD